MKWSRDDDEATGQGIVLRFPSGFQVTLDLRGPPREEPEGDPSMQPQPARPSAGGQGQPMQEGGLPLGLDNARAQALLAWNMVGLSLFAGDRRPNLQEVANEAERVLLALVMERHGGNLTHMAKELNASRRTVRERLKRGGMYDWGRMEDGDDSDGEHDGGAEGEEPDREHDDEHDRQHDDDADEHDRQHDDDDGLERDRVETRPNAEIGPRFELEEAHGNGDR